MANSQFPDDNFKNDDILGTDFDWLANVYNRHGALNHPSELHGLMAGELVGGLQRTPGDWLAQVLDHMGVEDLDSERQANVADDLIEFYNKASSTLSDEASQFNLLLPDDDYELSERIESLVVWVRGFLEGISISASDRLAKLADDTQEILKDLVEICQLDSRVAQSESGEKDFFEITEYVRVGILNMYAELNPGNAQKQKIADHMPTLH